MSDGAVTWMSYDELAERFGINRESARQLVIRKRWSRRKGNDGKARVGVPDEALRPDPRPDPRPDTGNATRSDTGASTSENTSDQPSDVTAVVQALTRHIGRLEAEIEELKLERGEALALAADRDTLAARLEALQTVLEIEKQRTEEWRAVADRFASQAEKLAARATRKPWWMRFVG